MATKAQQKKQRLTAHRLTTVAAYAAGFHSLGMWAEVEVNFLTLGNASIGLAHFGWCTFIGSLLGIYTAAKIKR